MPSRRGLRRELAARLVVRAVAIAVEPILPVGVPALAGELLPEHDEVVGEHDRGDAVVHCRERRLAAAAAVAELAVDGIGDTLHVLHD